MACCAANVQAQQRLSLDSCRAMALRNNKTLSASRLQLDMAHYKVKAAKTKYLPHVSALGGYELTSREISLLSDDQKASLSSAGTHATGALHNDISSALSGLAQQGAISPELANGLGNLFGQVGSKLGSVVDGVGQKVVDALLSGGGSFAYQNRQLEATMKKTIEYDGQEKSLTLYWNVSQSLMEGTYQVSIFADGNMIGSRSFSFK